MRLNFYYKKHLRSLFLSKFLYISLNQIIKLNFGILQLGTKKKKINYGLAYLFLMLLTGIQPVHSLTFDMIRGKKKSKFNSFFVKFQKKNFFIFLEKLTIYYFVNFENWIGLLEKFYLKNFFSIYHSLRIFDFSIFFELDFLLNFNFSNLKSISSKWCCFLFFCNTANSSFQFITLLRSLEIPVNLKKNGSDKN